MKKSLLLFTAALCLLSSFLHAQTKFLEGTIVYKIDVESDNEQVKQMLNNSSLTMRLKNKKSQAEMAMGAMMNIKVLSFSEEKKFVMLMDMMGQKKQINMTEKDFEEYKKKNKKDYKVEYLKDTKTILGYNCKKALIKGEDDKKLEVWYTEDIAIDKEANSLGSDLSKINGFPMSYQMAQNGMIMTLTVSSIDKTPVDEKIFDIPAGYDIMDFQELMKAQAGQK